MGTTVLETLVEETRTETATTFRRVEPRLRAVDRTELRSIADGLTARLVAEAMDETAERVQLNCAGRTIEAVPLDPRRIVRAMARYACFN